MTQDERQRYSQFLGRSVEPKTARVYEGKPVDTWRTYLAARFRPERHPGNFLERVGSEQGKANQLGLFYMHLYEAGRRGDQVQAMSTALKLHFEKNGRSVEFYDSSGPARARKAAGRKGAAVKAFNSKQKAKRFLALGLELVLGIRERYWVGTSWETASGLDARGTWLLRRWIFDPGRARETLEAPKAECEAWDVWREYLSTAMGPRRYPGVFMVWSSRRSSANGRTRRSWL